MAHYEYKIIYFLTIYFGLLLGGSWAGCPSTCTCTEDAVSCIQKNLECVPNFESLRNNPKVIDISGNKINMITPMDLSFDQSVEVIELYLNSSEVVTIEDESFDEMVNLQELYLSNNLLNSVPEDMIINHRLMLVLDLSYNLFEDQMPVIKSSSLEVLNLANSHILQVQPEALQHLPQLRVLLLQQNNIKFIPPSAFLPLKQLFFVGLAYNAWICNCDTINLFDYFSANKLINNEEPIQCLTTDKQFVNILEKDFVNNFQAKCLQTVNTAKEDFKFFEELARKNASYNDLEKQPEKFSFLVESTYNESITDPVNIIGFSANSRYFSFHIVFLIACVFLFGLIVGGTIVYNVMQKDKSERSDSTVRLMVS